MTAPGIACHIVYCLPADVSREVQELEHDIGGFIHREEVRRALAVVWDLAEFGPGRLKHPVHHPCAPLVHHSPAS